MTKPKECPLLDDDTLKRARSILADADVVLVGAGAGLSASAGLDYLDEPSFAAMFPAMVAYGFRYQYQLLGFRFPEERLKWGYYSVALNNVYGFGPSQPYRDLRALIGSRDYFVVTSNVDRFFHKNGFDDDKIYTPQGDYEWFQCLKPCSQDRWDLRPHIAAMFPAVDRDTQRVNDVPTPVCPNCGGEVFMNVRGGGWFVEGPQMPYLDKLQIWLEQNKSKTMAILELGAGYNTPGVIRMPMEGIARSVPNASLIRINSEYPDGEEVSVAIAGDAGQALSRLLDRS